MNDQTPSTPEQFVETMFRSSIEADRLAAEYVNDNPLRQAETQACVNGFVAGIALENLRRYAPEAAQAVAERLTRVLSDGDVAGPAYRAAKMLDHDPDQWIAEFEKRAALRREAAVKARSAAKGESADDVTGGA